MLCESDTLFGLDQSEMNLPDMFTSSSLANHSREIPFRVLNTLMDKTERVDTRGSQENGKGTPKESVTVIQRGSVRDVTARELVKT
jgi:hypothetical protein